MNMQQVVTAEQAKKITRGRTPLVPVAYENAVKALAECISLDEAKYWDNKADALAAWAKIYRDGKALRQAKQLKLHAFRRMGQIAGELKPITNGKGGRQPGSMALLRDSGLNHNQAIASRRLANITERRFNKILDRPYVQSPSTIVQDLWVRDDAYADFVRVAQSFRSVLRRVTPASVATVVKGNDRYLATSRELVVEITDWLDAFDQRLPKVKA